MTAAGQEARELQRVSIISAALEMLDESGLESFSMRKLATRLGMSVGNLYLYFQDRDELLDSVRDRILEAIKAEPIDDRPDWQAAAKQVMRHYRAHLLRHPGAMILFQRSRSISPAMIELGAIFTGILRRAGIEESADIVLYSRVFFWTLCGFVAQEEMLGHRATPGAGRVGQALTLPPATMELLLAQPDILRHMAEIDVDQLFEATVDAVIGGIAALAAGRKAAGPGSGRSRSPANTGRPRSVRRA